MSRWRSQDGADDLAPPTVGVEEEFLLVDPATGAVAPAAPQVVATAAAPGRVAAEILRYMVEARTPVCRTLGEVRAGLAEGRARAGRAAAAHEVALLALGVPPAGLPGATPVSDAPRYAALHHRFPSLIVTSGTCSCHVHVGVPVRDAGLEIVVRLRPWLPTLVALGAASPVWEGHDSGWASARFPLASRWPTVRPPPAVGSLREYDARVRAAVRSGRALDARSVYYWVRLSPRYPTVEVRVADVCPTLERSVVWAGLVRALVAAIADEARREVSTVAVGEGELRRSCWTAARLGLAADLPDPRTGRTGPAARAVERLLDVSAPFAASFGDEGAVGSALTVLADGEGSVAAQRRLLRTAGSTPGFVRAMAALTLEGTPAPASGGDSSLTGDVTLVDDPDGPS